ncbi:hypothetical protein CRG98_029559 [Punica granatum]|uniref:Uncharacterized protein n=1 Tax=Punica granatum TaxID=22663 RepID=A0A2I0J1E3_PUNGR|nr:hypothetical protein CRG98_029559 [Punica granatum]
MPEFRRVRWYSKAGDQKQLITLPTNEQLINQLGSGGRDQPPARENSSPVRFGCSVLRELSSYQGAGAADQETSKEGARTRGSQTSRAFRTRRRARAVAEDDQSRIRKETIRRRPSRGRAEVLWSPSRRRPEPRALSGGGARDKEIGFERA